MDEDNLSKYISVKNELGVIYHHTTESIDIRSKCDWYEQSEKSTKYFFDLDKQQGSEKVVDDKKITNQSLVLEHVREFHQTLFK